MKITKKNFWKHKHSSYVNLFKITDKKNGSKKT